MGKCQYCRFNAGFFRRICRDCTDLLEALKGLQGAFSFRELLDGLMQTNASNEKIERFLEADIQGMGSIRDMITARMTNQLAHTMGQPTDMAPKKVKMIREMEKKNPTPNDLPGPLNPYRK